MPTPDAPRCPACAAPLPHLERQEILTCESCGTDVNADYQPRPTPPPRSPPLCPDRTFSSDYENPADWEAGPYVHAVLTATDPAAAIALSRGGNGHLAGDDLLLWTPALALGILQAEREGLAALADELTLLAREGGSERKYATPRDDSPEAIAARKGRRLSATDFPPAQRIAPKTSWTYLQVAEGLLSQAPKSPAGMILLTAAGPASLRRFLDLAAEAEHAGDDDRLSEALGCIRRIITQTQDDWAFGVVLDAATYLLPRLPARTQQGVMDALGDLADLAVDEDGSEYCRQWRGPSDIVTALLLYADDLLHEHPSLAPRLLEAVARGARPHPFDRARWALALRAVPTAEGRAAALDLYAALFNERAEDAERDLIHEIGRRRSVEGWTPILKGDLPSALRLAVTRAGQAPCPSCGRALDLIERNLIVVCDHCGQSSRIAREIRTVRRVLSPDALDLHTWTPDRLVSTMLETDDDTLRLAIAAELASATSDGARFIQLAPALVTYMLADRIPSQIEGLLREGIESMLRFRDPAFLDALFQAIRERAFTEKGSVNLLRALERAGPAAAPLLFDLCEHVTADSDAWSRYTLSARQSAYVVVQHWAEKDRDAMGDFLLQRMAVSGPALSDAIPTLLGVHTFDEQPCGPFQERIVRFIDDHTDPAKVDWHKGVSRLGRDLPVPFLSWTAEDIAAAEKRLGLKWAQGGPLDTAKITADIPALPGSRTTLRQVTMLASQLESRWASPSCAQDLLARLRLAGSLRHDFTRVNILRNITEPPADMNSARRRSALGLLAELPASPNLDPWTAMVRRALAAAPGHDPDRAQDQTEGQDQDHTPAAVRRRSAGVRGAILARLRRLFRR